MKPGYKQTDVGLIPEEWDVCPVAQKGDVLTGKALAVNGSGRQRPYLRTKNVFDGRIDIDDVLTMPMTDEEFAHFRVRRGDVLLNEGQSLELVGRCAMYREEYPEPCAIQNQLIRFRAKGAVSSVFASYLFRHCQQTGVFARIALQTTSIAHLGGSRFARLLLAWPKSEHEQCSVAKALSDVDALIDALDRLIAKKRNLKQGVIQQLLTGKTRLSGFCGEWANVQFADIADKSIPWSIGGGPFGSNLKASDYTDEGVRIIQLQNIGDGQFHDDYAIYTSEEKADELLCNNIFPGEIILSKMGDPVARACFIPTVDRRYLMSSDGIRLAVDPKRFNKRFVHDYINSPYFRKKAIESSTGSTRQRIGLVELKRLPFIEPPLPEQNAIAEVLSDMDADLSALEQRRDKTRALKQGMMQELLTGRTRLA